MYTAKGGCGTILVAIESMCVARVHMGLRACVRACVCVCVCVCVRACICVDLHSELFLTSACCLANDLHSLFSLIVIDISHIV